MFCLLFLSPPHLFRIIVFNIRKKTYVLYERFVCLIFRHYRHQLNFIFHLLLLCNVPRWKIIPYNIHVKQAKNCVIYNNALVKCVVIHCVVDRDPIRRWQFYLFLLLWLTKKLCRTKFQASWAIADFVSDIPTMHLIIVNIPGQVRKS